jgi:hypothetical protein
MTTGGSFNEETALDFISLFFLMLCTALMWVVCILLQHDIKLYKHYHYYYDQKFGTFTKLKQNTYYPHLCSAKHEKKQRYKIKGGFLIK